MQIKTLVSVVMIAYEQEKFIRDAIGGVLMQKINFDLEFIIADDNSQDNTQSIVQSFSSHPNFHWIKYTKQPENIGMMANFIWALNEAKGKYVAVCEGDDFWIDINKLQNQFDFLESNSQCLICGSKIVNVNSTETLLNVQSINFDKYKRGIYYNFEEVCLSNRIPTVSVFFRNCLSDISLNLLEDSPHGDWPLWLSICQTDKTKDVFISDSITSSYRVHQQGVYSMVNDVKKKLNTARTISVNNKITKGSYLEYCFLLCHFLLKNNPIKDEFFKENFQNIDLKDEVVLRLKKVIEKTNIVKYTYEFNTIFKKSKHKNQILQLYKESKPTFLVYFYPCSINWTIFKHYYFLK